MLAFPVVPCSLWLGPQILEDVHAFMRLAIAKNHVGVPFRFLGDLWLGGLKSLRISVLPWGLAVTHDHVGIPRRSLGNLWVGLRILFRLDALTVTAAGQRAP